jgi:hypothetical protein
VAKQSFLYMLGSTGGRLNTLVYSPIREARYDRACINCSDDESFASVQTKYGRKSDEANHSSLSSCSSSVKGTCQFHRAEP